ncbi:MAG: hypothetical protein BGO23_01560 [Solirubrobacterales bacterium 67-14]|nr:MAG: hypothetical protein BGO23_01560 [Solirubrobacterales bacterium 67-14]
MPVAPGEHLRDLFGILGEDQRIGLALEPAVAGAVLQGDPHFGAVGDDLPGREQLRKIRREAAAGAAVLGNSPLQCGSASPIPFLDLQCSR